MKLSKILLMMIIIVVLCMGMTYGQVLTDLEIPNSIPCYCQETWFWCGAAVGQMILEGFPGGLEFPYSQTDVWNTIQLYKDDPLVNWYTDPDGLRGALMDLGSAPGVNWSIYARTDKTELMYHVAYWMKKREYPVAILINDWAHWVNIVAVETDVDPLTNSAVTLQWIKIFNSASPWACPAATTGGVTTSMTGTAWYNPANNYLDNPGNYPASKWDGNFLAVIEPPVKKGVAKAPEAEIVQSGEIIPPGEAVQMMYKWLDEYKLYEDKTYAGFRHLKPLEPLLVNKKFGAYYIVPLGYPEDNIAQGAVILNGYTGGFEEIGRYDTPGTYLSEGDAVRIALNYVKCKCDAFVERANLIYRYTPQSAHRYAPLWEIQIYAEELIKEDIRVLYVTQAGEIFVRFPEHTLGD